MPRCFLSYATASILSGDLRGVQVVVEGCAPLPPDRILRLRTAKRQPCAVEGCAVLRVKNIRS
jgi:hypothetical protein